MRGRRKATCDSGSYPTFVRLRTPRSCNANWVRGRLTVQIFAPPSPTHDRGPRGVGGTIAARCASSLAPLSQVRDRSSSLRVEGRSWPSTASITGRRPGTLAQPTTTERRLRRASLGARAARPCLSGATKERARGSVTPANNAGGPASRRRPDVCDTDRPPTTPRGVQRLSSVLRQEDLVARAVEEPRDRVRVSARACEDQTVGGPWLDFAGVGYANEPSPDMYSACSRSRAERWLHMGGARLRRLGRMAASGHTHSSGYNQTRNHSKRQQNLTWRPTTHRTLLGDSQRWWTRRRFRVFIRNLALLG